MSAEMKFSGRLEFADADELADALSDAGGFLDDEPELAALLKEEECIVLGAEQVTIDIDLSGPAAWFFTIEGIVESLVEVASGGQIDCWYDEEPMDPYLPDVD